MVTGLFSIGHYGAYREDEDQDQGRGRGCGHSRLAAIALQSEREVLSSGSTNADNWLFRARP